MLDSHIVRESELELERIACELDAGKLHSAAEMLEALINKDPTNDRVKLKLAEVQLENKDFDAASQVLATLSEDAKRETAYNSLTARVEFALSDSGALSASELTQRVSEDANDVAARYSLGIRYAVENKFEAAMEQFLEVAKRDRSFKDDAGRKGLLRVFDILGGEGATVSRYRTLLARALN
jgi:putative thioredoxin